MWFYYNNYEIIPQHTNSYHKLFDILERMKAIENVIENLNWHYNINLINESFHVWRNKIQLECVILTKGFVGIVAPVPIQPGADTNQISIDEKWCTANTKSNPSTQFSALKLPNTCLNYFAVFKSQTQLVA